MFLSGRLAFRSGNLDEIEAALARNAAGRLLEAPAPRPAEVDFIANTLPLHRIEIVEVRCNTAITNKVEAQDRLRLFLLIDGLLDLETDGHAIQPNRAKGLYCIPAGQSWKSKQQQSYHVISIRMEMSAICQTLSALIDEPCRNIVFDAAPGAGAKGFYLRISALQFVNDMHALSGQIIPNFSNRLETIFMTRLLLLSKHNYSEKLESGNLSASEKQLARVEDYVYDNLGEPLDLSILAQVAGTSLSGIFRSFKRYRGISPASFVKQIRLQSARVLLESNRTLGVLQVARMCGFDSFGHFSRAYFAVHSEYPSDTLRERGEKPNQRADR